MDFFRTKIEPKSIGCFFCIYLIVFGPRIGGIIDLSVLTSGILLLFVLGKGQISLQTKKISTIVLLLIIDVFLVSSLSDEGIDLLFLLKFIRVLLALLCISIYVDLDVFAPDTIRNSLINVLLTHAIVIIIGSTIWPEFQNILKPLSCFERNPTYFRSTGLTNGYDFAGVLCVFGLLITFFSKTEYLKTFKVFLFVAAAVLTSRMNMILTEATIFYLLIFPKGQKKVKLILFILFILSLFPILGIFLFTTQNQDNLIVQQLLKNYFFAKISTNLVYYYATSSLDNSLSEHFDFGSLTNIQFWFGSMQDSKLDPGYTQYIYRVGVFGACICLLFYISIILHSFKIKQASKQDTAIVVSICLMCITMSVKNSYLLARHVTETLLIMYSLLNNEYNKMLVRQTLRKRGQK